MDGNNDQGYPEKNMEPENLNDQTPNQSNQNSEAGNTYWESGNVEQDSTPVQGNLQYQTTNDLNSNQESQYQQIPVEPQKMKSRKKFIAAAAILVFILAIAGTAFAFQDKIMNALSLGSKSPEEYYAYVEEKAIDKAVDKLLASVNGYNFEDDMAVHATMDFSYDKATVSSLLKGYAGMSLEDFENYIGISLDEIGMDMTVALDDSNIYEHIGLSLNQLDIITLDIFLDSVKKEMLVRVPELSPAYLSQSLDTPEYGMSGFDFNGSTDLAKTIYSKETGDFLKRYTAIITSQIKEVDLTKNVDVKADNITVNANKLSVIIDEATIIDMAKEILKKAKDDSYLLELLPSFGVTKEDYQETINDALSEIDNEIHSDDVALTMNVYANNDGEIIGRDIELISDGSTQISLGYKYITKGNKSAYDFYIADDKGTKMITAVGSHEEDKNSYDGDVTIDLNADSLDLPTGVTLTVKYEDARSEVKDGKSFAYGNYTLSSPSLMGMEFALDYDVEGQTQKAKFSANMGSTPLVTLDMTAEYLDNYKIPAPSASDQVITDAESWAATMNIEKFISELSTKLGVDIQSIFDSFSGMYY